MQMISIPAFEVHIYQSERGHVFDPQKHDIVAAFGLNGETSGLPFN
jgi:hypothetical protein